MKVITVGDDNNLAVPISGSAKAGISKQVPVKFSKLHFT